MSNITESVDFDRIKPEDLQKYLAIFGAAVVQTINGNLDFSTNFNCKLHSVTFGAADTNVAVTHGLGRVPAGYITYKATAALVVYDGSTASTTSEFYLRASAIGVASVIVF